MEKVKLTKICNPKQWKTISTSELKVNGYPVYGANGIIGYYSEYNHENETVAITCRGATCGSINITKPMSYITGNAMCIDELREDIMVKYLYYCLKNYNFNKVISGSAQPQITRQNLEKVYLNIGTIEEQQEIVEILDMVSSIIEKRKVQLEGLEDLIKSRFAEVFGNPISNPYDWQRLPLEDCIESIDNGKSFICENNARVGCNPAILKLSAVTYGRYNPDENKAIINTKDFVESAEVHDGDLLFTRKNTPELVGMSAYITSTPEKLMMPDLIFRLNTKKNCNKVFLWQLINHDLFRNEIKNLASGSAKSMSNISKERLRKLFIYLPPIDLQEKFAIFVQQVDRSRADLQNSLDEMQLLFDSLMKKYFN